MTGDSQRDRLDEAYDFLKESDDHDYERVVYESPNDLGWADVEGYVTEVFVADEPALRVVREDGTDMVPWHRVIRTHLTEEPTDE